MREEGTVEWRGRWADKGEEVKVKGAASLAAVPGNLEDKLLQPGVAQQ